MKIAFLEPHLDLFGGIRRILELANRLVERGHDVTIFHSDGSPCEWMRCEAKVKTARQVLEEEHDVLIFNDPVPLDYRLAKKARARLKVYYVLVLYEKSLLTGPNLKIFLPWVKYRRTLYLKKFLRRPYLVLANATWLVDWLTENMAIEARLLLGGVDSGVFHPVEVNRDSNEIRILCTGDPRERKGIQTVHMAVELARESEPRIVLDTYYGKGISQEKMAETYSQADIFVDAQSQAGWNNPVAEAMACQTAVVCTDIGGVRDFAFHEETVLLVPPRDPAAMAAAILRLIRDKPLRESLRGNAYRHITTFDWGSSAQRLEEILTEELEKAPPTYANFHLESIDAVEAIILLLLNPLYALGRLIRDLILGKPTTL